MGIKRKNIANTPVRWISAKGRRRKTNKNKNTAVAINPTSAENMTTARYAPALSSICADCKFFFRFSFTFSSASCPNQP